MDNTKFVDSNSYHSIASDNNGFVYTAGYNGYGELGDGTYTSTNEFNVIGDTYVHVEKIKLQLKKEKLNK